jgi:hypothetical protein
MPWAERAPSHLMNGFNIFIGLRLPHLSSLGLLQRYSP